MHRQFIYCQEVRGIYPNKIWGSEKKIRKRNRQAISIKISAPPGLPESQNICWGKCFVMGMICFLIGSNGIGLINSLDVRVAFEGMSENHFLNQNLFPTALYNRRDFEGKFLKIYTHAAAHLYTCNTVIWHSE